MTPGTVPCVVSEGHDTAGLSPVSWRENAKVKYGNLAFGENTLALRLENVSLREPLSDLRAGYANPQCKPYGLHCRVRFLVRVTNTKSTDAIASVLFVLVTRTGIEPMLPP